MTLISQEPRRNGTPTNITQVKEAWKSALMTREQKLLVISELYHAMASMKYIPGSFVDCILTSGASKKDEITLNAEAKIVDFLQILQIAVGVFEARVELEKADVDFFFGAVRWAVRMIQEKSQHLFAFKHIFTGLHYTLVTIANTDRLLGKGSEVSEKHVVLYDTIRKVLLVLLDMSIDAIDKISHFPNRNLPQSGIQKHLSVLSKPQIIVLHLWSEIMVQKLAEERTSLGKGEVL